MEIAVLLTTFLSPFLPFLINIGKPVSEEAGKKLGAKLGEGTWEVAKRAWEKIAPKVNEKPLAKGAAAAVSEDPQDKDAQTVLAKQVEKLLTANPDLSKELQDLLVTASVFETKEVEVTQTVTGDKNIIIGEGNGIINITQR